MESEEIIARIQERLEPKPLLSVSEWSNTYRFLSAESSAMPGKFDINITPFMREIVDAMGDPTVPEVRVMKSSQVAYSENLNNFIGRQIHLNPGPIMMMQPTLEATEKYSKTRISPMIRDTPVLAELIDDRSRTSGNTIREKSFPGGYLFMVGANSPSSLASQPVRDVVIDEEDRTAASAGEEGDPEKLATRRQTTYFNAKLIAGGTPVIEGKSKTARGYEKGDQRLYMVECPHCHDHISLEWEQFDHDPESETYAQHKCQLCGDYIGYQFRHTMVQDAELGGTAYWMATVPGKEVRSYYIWSAYSPFPAAKWENICKEYNEAKGDPELMQTFYNTVIGRPYKHQMHDLSPEALFKNARLDVKAQLPKRVRCITAGVDTQDDRFEVTLCAWAQGEEGFVLDHATIKGDPESRVTREKLYRYLKGTKYEREDGRSLGVSATMIDSGGHRSDSVYLFARGKQSERIFACKGISTYGSPILAGFSKLKKAGIVLARVDTNTAKELIYSKLAGTEGAMSFEFSDQFDLAYFKGLISEDREIRDNGAIRFVKSSTGVRNEPLDCLVYAYAALRSLPCAKQLRKSPSSLIKKAEKIGKEAVQAEENLEAEEESEELDVNETPDDARQDDLPNTDEPQKEKPKRKKTRLPSRGGRGRPRGRRR